MAQYIDCYLLVDSRNSSIVKNYLDKIIPQREEVAVDYPVPEYVDNPECIFSNVDELLSYLEEKASESYSIYWDNENKNEKIKFGMVFYTDDGKIIFGYSIVGNDPQNEEAVSIYAVIKRDLGSSVGCITVEEVPPFNSIEFIDFCNNRFYPI